MWRPGADVKCLPQSLSMTQALSPSLEVTVLADLAGLAGQRAPWVLLPSVGIIDAPPLSYGCWGWDSGPSTLLTESSPKSLGLEFKTLFAIN